jgi:DNA-binding transcriptional MerR regulator
MADVINGKRCLYCGKLLTGIKRKYCSEKCGTKDWRLNHHRAYRLIEKRYRDKTGDRYYKKYYQNNKHTIGQKRILKQYGITLEAYNKMLKDQNFCCAICKRHKSHFKRNLDIDHNHKNNQIRGLLCWSCNTMLGCANDSIDTIQSAIEYLKKYNIH